LHSISSQYAKVASRLSSTSLADFEVIKVIYAIEQQNV